ncbi:hypothetical protein WJX74_002548 [Apatococcus lobatus]|uniref:Reverse transcriptase domain-containing protein n=1 Tax=Apatococcus lobatus TaxID=904363 RepID=A0AAW1QMT1_9CHLO
MDGFRVCILRDGLRLAYRVYGINPSTLYLQYSATKISNIGSWVRSEAYEALITAILLAAQEKNKDEELEKITISADNPFLPGYGALVREANTVLNPVYSPQTTGQPSTSGNALENNVSGGIGPLKQETQDVDAFQKALSGRQDAKDRYRQAADSKPQPNLLATVMHNPLTQQPIKQVHAAAATANDDDSDDVSVASQQIDDARALRMFNDQERAKASQRRDVIDKTIRFQPGLTYLHDFIEVTSGLLQSKHFLEDKEKAQLLVHMLDNSVKDKLKGDARIINSSHPAQVFELLRNTYPVNQQQLSTELAGITQGIKQDAAPFIDGIKAKYIMHGVPLPTMHSQYLTMHLKFNTKFSQHMQNYDNQVTFDRQKNKQPAAQDEASGSDPEQHDHAQSEEEYESFQEQDVDSADESETDDIDLLQAFPIQLSVMQPQTLDSRDDSSPMVIFTIAKSDFIVTHDLQLNYKLGVADMGVPGEEWIGMGSNPGRQTIDIAWKSKVKKFQPFAPMANILREQAITNAVSAMNIDKDELISEFAAQGGEDFQVNYLSQNGLPSVELVVMSCPNASMRKRLDHVTKSAIKHASRDAGRFQTSNPSDNTHPPSPSSTSTQWSTPPPPDKAEQEKPTPTVSPDIHDTFRMLQKVMPGKRLAESQMLDLAAVLSKHHEAFATSSKDYGKVTGDYSMKHSIDTAGAKAVSQKPYRHSRFEEDFLKKLIAELQACGLIRPSVSPWMSPVVLVKKKDGSLRMCIDFRRLNAVTALDPYQLPRVDDLTDRMNDCQYFTSIDVLSVFWNMPMEEEDIPKTGFSTSFGNYEWTRMPFGLVNASASFQRLMDKLTKDPENAAAYIDDVFVFTATWEEHLTALDQTLGRMVKAGLKCKLAKCAFAGDSVKCLGHTVTKHGVTIDEDKLQAVKDLPVPSDKTGVGQIEELYDPNTPLTYSSRDMYLNDELMDCLRAGGGDILFAP